MRVVHIVKKVRQIDGSGAVGVRPSAAELLFFWKSRLPPIDFSHFLSTINKFAKSPSSRVGIPRFGFLITHSVIKDQKSDLDMALRPSYENFTNKDLHVGWQPWGLNGHKSGPRASPRVRIWLQSSYHIPRGLAIPKGTQS